METMSGSAFLEKILAYLADNKMKTTLETEVRFMVIEANNERSHAKGPGANFKPDPLYEHTSFKEN